MCLESVMGIMGITALTVAGLMVVLVILPVKDDGAGHQRKCFLMVLLCALLALRAAVQSMGPVWAQAIHALIGTVAGILFPWVLWILYSEARRKTELEKTG